MSVLRITNMNDFHDEDYMEAVQIITAGKPIDELIVESENEEITFHPTPDHLAMFLCKIQQLQVPTLTCRRVSFNDIIVFFSSMDVMLERCQYLRNVILDDCEGQIRMCQVLVKCPRLRSLTGEVTLARSFSPLDLKIKIEGIIGNLQDQYAITCFEVRQIEVFSQYAAQEETENRGQPSIISRIDTILLRNIKGYRKCRKAIYYWFLMKKCSKVPMFNALNMDVVRMIARMLHDSRGTKVWCV
jgi:hypothetical protein